ncbi:MAG: uracil-DNA glycosylase [Candidatus Melainabacteria bacterium]|jgi:DNA polymerase|nr:uracil-DNA glycosylase [Candidatus Melainabacteria bacterium]
MTQLSLDTSSFSVITSLEQAAAAAAVCQACGLCKTRRNVVFADGNPEAQLMIIGEGPGQREDELGLPFVGRAGQLLDKILASVNIDRKKDTYICNMVKCRPPGNRVPARDEMEACRSFLEAQIEFVKPKLIVLAGSTAVQGVLQVRDPISRIRGKWFDNKNGAKVMPVFHPSYLLRNESREVGSPKWLMWQDIKEIRRALDALDN